MKTQFFCWTATLSLTLITACKADDPMATDSAADSTGDVGATETSPDLTTAPTGETGETGETGTTEPAPTTTEPAGECADIEIAAIDEGSCAPLASDYQPRDSNSANDTWPACISDSAEYTQVVDGVPGSVARVDAYEEMAALLWNNAAELTAADFTAARDQYVIAEGLESRLNRREDLHYDPIPMDEWDPMVDGDKQCTVEALADKYPDRCAGPKRMKPILDEAFVAGQSGEGDARVHAARIHATLDWFLLLSVYKEAETCGSAKAADCDSAWAYYSGVGGITDGAGISAGILAASQNSHERLYDGILAVRCWRDLYKDPDYPLFPDLDADAISRFELGWEQLDQSLHRGGALLVRAHAVRYFEGLCGTGDAYQPAEWAYLQILGPTLQREADARDGAKAATLAALWANAEPTAQEVADGIAALDSIFACP